MKKTFFAMVMAGSSMVMFAQTNPTTPPTNPVNPTTTNPATNQTGTLRTTNPATTNGSVTNSTTDPMNSVNPSLNNNNANAAANSVNNAAWGNGTPPSWTWRSYGIWDADRNTGAYNGTNYNGAVNNSATANGNLNSNAISNTTTSNSNGNNSYGTGGSNPSSGNVSQTNAGLNSTGSYNAYSPTENVMLPVNVQTNYSKEYPTASATNGSWSQYGDWFYSNYMSNGRYSQIFYDRRGNGYSVALPVLNTYVPENIVASALQRYGSSLYSITTVKGNEGKDVYQINLLDRGQVKSEWLGDDGTAVANVYRVDEVATTNAGTMNSGTTTVEGAITTTDANAAMDNNKEMNAKKTKTKVLNEDGSKTKIKTKNGKTKVKEIPAPQNDMNQ